jgi:hypothetical protein
MKKNNSFARKISNKTQKMNLEDFAFIDTFIPTWNTYVKRHKYDHFKYTYI